jgi:ribosome biogenesis GTPase
MDPQLARAYEDQLGLKPVFLQRWLSTDGDRPLFRVAAIDRATCTLWGLDGQRKPYELRAQPGDTPLAVGDWVLVAETEDSPRVVQLLERATWLRRGAAHQEGREQLIAANLDVVFIVAAFSETEKLTRRALRARRFDRFIAAVVEGGAQPVVVLNKVDLAAHDADALAELSRSFSERLGGVPVVLTSTSTPDGARGLDAYLAPGETLAFVGASGVGKSSLVNRLLGEVHQEVQGVRNVDAKGRHTTTRRELVRLPGGAFLIDTPGVREFAVLADDHVAGFADIDDLARNCAFSDCSHLTEPGCAVRAAVSRGELLQERVDSHRDLERDAARQREKSAAAGRREANAEGRRFGRMVRTLRASHKPPR